MVLSPAGPHHRRSAGAERALGASVRTGQSTNLRKLEYMQKGDDLRVATNGGDRGP
jgi:hypothetical protein